VDTLARVAEKAYQNGALNPNAWRRTPIAFEQIKDSAMVNDPLTKYMFCSPSEGGVALVVCREDIAHRFTRKPVYVSAAAMRTRLAGAFEVYGTSVGLGHIPNATELASRAAYEIAGLGPKDIDIVQLQDTEAGAEVMHMAESGFCAHGEQERMLRQGETRIGGRLPINTDGGCLANGEPIGASCCSCAARRATGRFREARGPDTRTCTVHRESAQSRSYRHRERSKGRATTPQPATSRQSEPGASMTR